MLNKSILFKLFAVFLGLVLGAGTLLALNGNNTEAQEWFNNDWQYRKRIPISSTNGSDQSDVYIVANIDTSDSAKVQSDCEDIRFTNVSGELLKHYLATDNCGTGTSTFHIELPLLVDGDSNIFIYYVNEISWNYGESSGFSTLALNYSIGTIPSEENTPQTYLYYSFDDTNVQTIEDSNNNVNGTLGSSGGSDTNDPNWETESDCIKGNCLHFDGTDDYVDLGATSKLTFDTSTSFTISTWAKFNKKDGSRQRIISDYPGGPTPPQFINLSLNATENITFNLRDSNSNLMQLDDTEQIEVNKWYHIVAVRDVATDSLKLYVNGILKNSINDISTGTIGNSLGTYLGRNDDSSSPFDYNYLKGNIDEFKIYKYARTDSEIKSEYIKLAPETGASASLGVENKDYLDDLVGYWPMEDNVTGSGETISDESNTSNDMLTANAMDCDDYGIFGRSCNFNGSDDYLYTSSTSIEADNPEVTISAWINPSNIDPTGQHVIFWKEDDDQRLIILNNELRFTIKDSIGTTSNLDTAAGIIPEDEWTHIAGTYDGQTQKIYINGELIEQKEVGFELVQDGGTLRIGKDDGSRFFEGRIDEVRLYKKALGKIEIERLYNWAPDPIAYWKLDDNAGTTAQDSSVNGNTGTLYGSLDDDDWVPGITGSALKFDGTTTGNGDNYVHLGLDLHDEVKQGSIMAWFKADDSGDNLQPIISITENGFSDAINIYFNNSANTVQVWAADDSGILLELDSPTLSDITGWNHLAFIVDENGNSLYINGIKQNVSYSTGSNNITFFFEDLSENTTMYSLGGGNYNAGDLNDAYEPEMYEGLIDEVKFYDYPRTQEQIIRDMNAQVSTTNKLTEPILHLKFDEGSGTDIYNSGYMGGSATLTDAGNNFISEGIQNKALTLDGLNDRVQGFDSDPLEYTEGDLTLSTWFKLDSGDTDGGRIISKPWNGSGDYNYNLYIDSLERVSIRLHDGDLDTQIEVAEVSEALTYDTWYHIAATIDGSLKEGKIYLNGELKATGTHSITNLGPTQADQDRPLVVGCLVNYSAGWGGATSHCVEGEIDETKIFKYKLSQEQILQDYNRGSAIATPTGAAEIKMINQNSVPADPVAYWDFEENEDTGTVYNRISNSYNLTVDSAMDSEDWVPGVKGSAINLERVTNKCRLQSSTAPHPNTISFSFWIKPTAFDDFSYFLGWGDVNAGKYPYFLDISTNGNMSMRYGGTGSSNVDRYLVYTGLPLNEWSHIAITYTFGTGSSMQWYKNGTAVEGYWHVGNGNRSKQTYTGGQFTLGDLFRTGTNCYRAANIQLDEVKIFDYAISPAQVAYEYNRGKPLAHYKINECQGETVYDSSENLNHGTLVIGASGTNTDIGTCEGSSSDSRFNGAEGKFGAALNLDGTNDYVTIPDSDYNDFNTNSFTISYWEKTEIEAFGGVTDITKRTGNTGWTVGARNNGTTGRVQLFLGDGTDTESVWIDTNYDILEPNTWHHITAIVDRTNDVFKAYVDGIYVGEASISSFSGNVSNAANLNFGTFDDNGSYSFMSSTTIDDVRLYNYALSEEQIKVIMNNDSGLRFGPN
jgi:hypothetical protein